MTEADQTMLLLSLQKEMAEMKRKTEETTQKNEQELQVLYRKNEDMKKKLGEGGPSAVPTNVVGRSCTSPPNPRPAEGTRDKLPPHLSPPPFIILFFVAFFSIFLLFFIFYLLLLSQFRQKWITVDFDLFYFWFLNFSFCTLFVHCDFFIYDLFMFFL